MTSLLRFVFYLQHIVHGLTTALWLLTKALNSSMFRNFRRACRQGYPAYLQWFRSYRRIVSQTLKQKQIWGLIDLVGWLLIFFGSFVLAVLFGLYSLMPSSVLAAGVILAMLLVLFGLFVFVPIVLLVKITLRLRWFPRLASHLRQRAIRLAQVNDPDTPVKLLLELGAEFPRELLQNPVFALLLLEDPNLLATMPRGTLYSLLNLDNIPVGYLEQAATLPNAAHFAKVIAQHPNASQLALERIAIYSGDLEVGQALLEKADLSAKMLEQLATYGHEQVQLHLAKQGNLPSSLLDLLAEHGHDQVRLHLAQRPNISVEMLACLAQRGNATQLYLAQQQQLPEAVLNTLVRRGQTEVRSWLLQRSDLTPAILKQLAKLGDSNVQLLIEQKLASLEPDLADDILVTLAEQGSKRVQFALLNNLQTYRQPSLVLTKLTERGHCRIKLQIARQPDTPPEILEKLSTDTRTAVRHSVASNPSTPLSLVKQLAADSDPYVSRPARRKLRKLSERGEV